MRLEELEVYQSAMENRQYGYYSRGSLFESKTWLTKARNRSLVLEEDFREMDSALDTMGRRLNAYIKSIGNTQYQVKEDGPDWDTNDQ